jgi:hypothetical protein
MAKAKQAIMKNPFVHHGARVLQQRFRKYKADQNRLKQIALRAKSYKNNKAAVSRLKRKANTIDLTL